METKSQSNDDGSDGDSSSCSNSILRLSDFKKEILISITDNSEKIGYIKGVLLNVDTILKELKSDGVLKILEFTDKEEEEEIRSFYIQVLSKGNCKDNALYIVQPVSCIYLMPGPLEKIGGEVKYIMNPNDDQMVLLKKKLVKFYESVGFERIGETEFYCKYGVG